MEFVSSTRMLNLLHPDRPLETTVTTQCHFSLLTSSAHHLLSHFFLFIPSSASALFLFTGDLTQSDFLPLHLDTTEETHAHTGCVHHTGTSQISPKKKRQERARKKENKLASLGFKTSGSGVSSLHFSMAKWERCLRNSHYLFMAAVLCKLQSVSGRVIDLFCDVMLFSSPPFHLSFLCKISWS